MPLLEGPYAIFPVKINSCMLTEGQGGLVRHTAPRFMAVCSGAYLLHTPSAGLAPRIFFIFAPLLREEGWGGFRGEGEVL